MKNNVALILVGTASAFVGAGAGYIVAEKRLAKKFEERLEKETEGMREFYTASPAEKFATPEAAVAALVVPDLVETVVANHEEESAAHPRPDTMKVEYHKIAERYQAPTETEEIPEQTPRVETEVVEARNAFEQQKIADRGQVYLITEEEMAEGDYLSASLTWYTDGILCDSDEEPIKPPSSHIGDITMEAFGHIRSQPDVILVRNEVMSLDFEITRSATSYAESVLGEVPET